MHAHPLYLEARLERPGAAEPHKTDLVRRAQEGDVPAFEQLYRDHVGRVYAVCLRMSGDRQKAEELTQDSFVRAWGMIRTFRGESAFSSWLHRLTVNVVLVAIRTEKRYAARIESTEDVSKYDQSDRTVPKSETVDLDDAIAQLPHQARIIFVLHDIEGYKHEEIAEQLGLAVGTSKAQLHRARKLLREALEQ